MKTNTMKPLSGNGENVRGAAQHCSVLCPAPSIISVFERTKQQTQLQEYLLPRNDTRGNRR